MRDAWSAAWSSCQHSLVSWIINSPGSSCRWIRGFGRRSWSRLVGVGLMASRNPVIADHPRPARPRHVNQPVQAELGEPVAPPPHRADGQAQSFGKRRDSAQAAQPVDGIGPTRRGRRVDDLLVDPLTSSTAWTTPKAHAHPTRHSYR
jgi:hypothetical protein